MKKLLFVVFLLMSIGCYSQQKTLIADETVLTVNASGSFRIVTSIKLIADGMLHYKWTSITTTRKKDRKGEYLEYSFSFPEEEWNNIAKYLNTL